MIFSFHPLRRFNCDPVPPCANVRHEYRRTCLSSSHAALVNTEPIFVCGIRAGLTCQHHSDVRVPVEKWSESHLIMCSTVNNFPSTDNRKWWLGLDMWRCNTMSLRWRVPPWRGSTFCEECAKAQLHKSLLEELATLSRPRDLGCHLSLKPV